MTEFDTVAKRLASAQCPEDVFGALARGEDQQHQLAVEYRRLVQVVHPDKHTAVVEHSIATVAFATLRGLRDHAERKIADGSYGDHKPMTSLVPPRPKLEPQTIRTPLGEYIVDEHLAEGDLADVYHATCTVGRGRTRADVAFKLAHHPGDNDLLEREAKILGSFWPKSAKEESGRRFIPRCRETFMLRGTSKTSRTLRRANVISYAHGHVSLVRVGEVYPRGLDFRDAVWIFKRILYALWFTHTDARIVHGAVLPPHVLVHPVEHSAKLVDWCYAVENWPARTGKIGAISTPYKAFYPPEVFAKQPPTPATDIYMAAKCAVVLLGGHADTNVIPSTVPAPIQGFLRSCLFAAPGKRPSDAGALHEEFDELLVRLVGKPTYRLLVMPEK